MISDALRIDIEKWSVRKDENPVFHRARTGRLTRAMITRYIANVTYMIGLTPRMLMHARDEARKRNDQPLAQFFQQKLEEETGHVEWGEADLESLTKVAVAPTSTATTASIEAMAKYLTSTIDRDPALYLAYVAFTEYITVLLGPELLSSIEEHCGVPRTSMSVIDNHIVLDQGHVEENFGIIDDLVPDPRKLSPMRNTLSDIFGFFDGFCREVALTDANDESTRHVSAA
jgi:hypothetical protein